MKNIRRKITVSVLGTMLFVFAAMLSTVNIFIPEYLTSEAQKAILLEDERKYPIPLAETMDDGEEHFLTSSVRYLEVEDGLTKSEHLSKAEYQLRKYCREEKPSADEFHTLKTGGSRFVFRISQVEADEYEDAYSYILYVDVGAVMQYSAYLNAVFSWCWQCSACWSVSLAGNSAAMLKRRTNPRNGFFRMCRTS